MIKTFVFLSWSYVTMIWLIFYPMDKASKIIEGRKKELYFRKYSSIPKETQWEFKDTLFLSYCYAFLKITTTLRIYFLVSDVYSFS